MIKIYSIYDKVAEEYGPLFQAVNDGVACRQFARILQADEINADDYQLYFLADYYPRAEITSTRPSECVLIESFKPRLVPFSVKPEVSHD